MKMVIKNSIIETIITVVLTFIFAWINGQKASIELASVKMVDRNYYNTILIKNLQNSEYLKDIEFVIDSKIDVISILENGEMINNSNKIKIKEQVPQNVITINFITSEKMSKNNLMIIKNNQKIEYNYFNDRKNINLYVVIVIVIYALIDFIISLFTDSRQKKRIEKYNKDLEKTEEKAKIAEEKILDIEKTIAVRKIVYLKELNDMEKEVSFYQKLLLKQFNNKITKEELEKLITKELKLFSKKKMKSLNYEDVITIVENMIENKKTV